MDFEDLFNKYLANQLKRKMTEHDAREIFEKAAKDYFSKKISLDFLIGIATQLYFELLKPSDYTGGVFHNLIEKTADLDFYIEESKKGDKEAKRYIKEYFSELREYISKAS